MKTSIKIRKQKRIRAKVQGTSQRPRLSVYRSNKYIYAQLIDDENGKTIVGVSQKHLSLKELKKPVRQTQGKSDAAKELGKLIAKKAIEKKIKEVVFDKGSYAYHGRVKTFAQGAREGGLEF